jgi:hypothetical protein
VHSFGWRTATNKGKKKLACGIKNEDKLLNT